VRPRARSAGTPRAGRWRTATARGWPNAWAQFRALIRILSHKARLSRAIWALICSVCFLFCFDRVCFYATLGPAQLDYTVGGAMSDPPRSG
jgi:hypothetical protein